MDEGCLKALSDLSLWSALVCGGKHVILNAESDREGRVMERKTASEDKKKA